jgi:hypothetical protein
VMRVPKDGSADVTWQSTVSFPKGAELVMR